MADSTQHMSGHDIDKVFTGSVPQMYERHLVPLIFEPYAADLANRLGSRSVTRVLEIAAGSRECDPSWIDYCVPLGPS